VVDEICPPAATNATKNKYATVENINYFQYEHSNRWYYNISWKPLNGKCIDYLSNRPQLSMVYTLGVGRTRKEFVNYEQQASDLRIRAIFPWVYRHNKPKLIDQSQPARALIWLLYKF